MATRRKTLHQIHKRKEVKALPDDFFPMPSAPSGQCRDAFLHELLEPYEDIKVAESPSVSRKAEARLTDDYLRWQRRSLYANKSMVDATQIYAPDIFQLLRDRYDDIATSIGFLAVLFELSELKNRMNAVRQSWLLERNHDWPIHMFSWSIQHYYARLNMCNMAYLDALELELKDQIECFKFGKDLKEIIRLVDAVTDDFKFKRDICTTSMLIIKDAEVDIMELIFKSHIEIENQTKQMVKALQTTPRSADPKHIKYKALQAKANYVDFVMPIEARYRLNWARTTIEQSAMYDDLSLKKLSDEVSYYKSRTMEFGELWELSTLAYDIEIQHLKYRIAQMELAYETDLERVEHEIQITNSKLLKAKEDLRFCKAQVPIFHLKIAEVLNILVKKPL